MGTSLCTLHRRSWGLGAEGAAAEGVGLSGCLLASRKFPGCEAVVRWWLSSGKQDVVATAAKRQEAVVGHFNPCIDW